MHCGGEHSVCCDVKWCVSPKANAGSSDANKEWLEAGAAPGMNNSSEDNEGVGPNLHINNPLRSTTIETTRRQRADIMTEFASLEQTEELDYEVYQTARRCSYDDYDGDDEVFVQDLEETRESMLVTVKGRPEPRIRRTSDVIDCVGEMSPASDRLRSFPEFPVSPSCREEFTVSPINREEEGADVHSEIVILHTRDSELKPFSLQNPPRGRPIPNTVVDSYNSRSPPATPGSDLGYCSTSTGTPPSSMLTFKPKWFRYSSSSIEMASPPSRIWNHVTVADSTPFLTPQDDTPSSSEPTKLEAIMPVMKDSNDYNMTHVRRGVALILNHEEFQMDGMPERKGSLVDVVALEAVYKELGFHVNTHHNLNLEGIKTVIDALAAEDHSDADCLVVTVLTHGLGTDCLLARDYPYRVERLWSPFTADRCISLAGKPKMFFIQACRGTKLDAGIKLVSRTQTDSGPLTYKLPSMADFLIAYSTVEGYYSWRHPEKGTWFIQCLCQVLSQSSADTDLLKMMTRVCRRVAVDYESYNDLYPDHHQQKQVPSINSTLLREVFFTPKKH